jgi:prophage DNA circulation protein
VQGVTQKLRNVQGKINGILNPLGDLSAAIDDLDATASGLLNTPTALRNKITDLVDSMYALADTSKSTLDRTTGLRTITGSAFELSRSVRVTKNSGMGGLGEDEPATGATSNDDRSAKNVRAIYRVARVTAVARQAETYADAPFDSASLASEVLVSIADETSALQEYSSGDDLFQALSDVRSAAARHLAQTAGSLPRTIVYTPKQELPALRIAKDIYGDARQEADIVARNRMEFPLFVSSAIEVLEP